MIYLDHASTSLPKREEAVHAASLAVSLPSPGRGRHRWEQEAARCVESAREAVLALGSFRDHVACFTSGATHALNQAILGAAPRRVALGPLVHNAVSRPVSAARIDAWTLPGDAMGRIDVEDAERSWVEGTDWVIVTHGSNVNGVVQSVDAIIDLAHRKGARVILDAAQTAGVLPLPAADMVAFGAHKGLGALPGVGALVVLGDLVLEPIVRGGVGFDSAHDDVPDELPGRLESGTPNLPAIAALGAAARVDDAWDWREARAMLVDALADWDVRCGELPIASIVPRTRTPLELEEGLDRAYDIAVRAGLHCAPSAHASMGTSTAGTLRVSLGRTTQPMDVELLVDALRALDV